MYKKDFIDTNDFTKQELLDIIDLSLLLKKCIARGSPSSAPSAGVIIPR